MVEVQDVSLRRGGEDVLRNFSWSTGKHNWVVSGPSGSGKSTLLELLAGKLLAGSGEIHYDFITETAEDLHWEARRQKILYIPAQDPQLHNHQEQYYQQRYYSLGDELTPTVREWLGRADEPAALPHGLSIDNLLDLDINRLSNGQLKKALLLKYLQHTTPRLLLWDFPFEGLDRSSRADLCQFLDQLIQATGMQLILADHRHELPTCITHRLLLPAGEVQRVGAEIPHVAVTAKHQSSTASAEIVVEMRDVRIQYGEKTILQHINWVIRRGDRWALTGPNGSGKTTLFSLIFADHPLAYSNEIYLFGRRRGTGESIWQIKSRIAYLGPEVIRFMNPASVQVSVQQFLTEHASDPAAIQTLALQFGAIDLLDKPVRRLSSGQLQTVMLMQFFLQDRELYLLDEPFQFLDDERWERISHYMQSHLGADKTLILISHHEEELARWVKERLVLKGRKVEG